MTLVDAKRLKYLPLSSRDKTHHLTPRATKSGYDHTQTKLLARAVARLLHLTEVHGDMGNKQIWRRGGGLKPQVLCKPRFTREIAAISFTIASFQIARVKRREARRSPKKPKKW